MQHRKVLGLMLGWGAHLARERMDARVAGFDLTRTQGHVLLYLYEHGGQASQREVAEFLRVKPSTANGILDRMAEKGLITRTVSEADARHRLITMTDGGRERQARLQEAFADMETMMMQGLSGAEQAKLLELLGRVIENLKEDRDG